MQTLGTKHNPTDDINRASCERPAQTENVYQNNHMVSIAFSLDVALDGCSASGHGTDLSSAEPAQWVGCDQCQNPSPRSGNHVQAFRCNGYSINGSSECSHAAAMLYQVQEPLANHCTALMVHCLGDPNTSTVRSACILQA